MRLLMTRTFVGDIGPHEIVMTFDRYEHDDGTVDGSCNEHFELEGDFVTYNELVAKFGKRNTDEFIQTANDNAR